MTELASINPKKSDTELAAAYRAELRPVLEQACEIITRAMRDGLQIGFNLGNDGIQQRVMSLTINKPL